MHILLVENDARVRSGLAAFLISRGFEVNASGSNLPESSVARPLDAVITGYRMSDSEISRIRALRDRFASGVPLIATVDSTPPPRDDSDDIEFIDARDGVGLLLNRLQELESRTSAE